MIGETLQNRYRIIGELGAGAMGIVFKAIDTKTDEEVAIKILPPALSRDRKYLKRFEREAEALRELHHPNIVPYIDSFSEDNNHYIVMAYMPGGTLQDRLEKQGALPFAEALPIAIQIADALIRAHWEGIVHRDIKPGNVLFDERGNPRLGDFGLARLEESTQLTGSGTRMGTPAYMSPEAWHGDEQDVQSDIWSFGVMLYEMLAGDLPFSGNSEIVIMRQVLGSEPPDIRTIVSDIPDGIYQILRKALAKDRDKRYTSIRDLSNDLERRAPSFPLPRRNQRFQRGLLVMGAVAVVTVFIGGAAFFLMRGGDNGRDTVPGAALIPSETPSPTETATATMEPSATNTTSPTVEPSATNTATSTEAPSATTTEAPTLTATSTPSPEDSTTPTQSAREVAQATVTAVALASQFAEATSIAQATIEHEQTLIVEEFIANQTATATLWTQTPTPTATATGTATFTPTHTLTPTHAPTLPPSDAKCESPFMYVEKSESESSTGFCVLPSLVTHAEFLDFLNMMQPTGSLRWDGRSVIERDFAPIYEGTDFRLRRTVWELGENIDGLAPVTDFTAQGALDYCFFVHDAGVLEKAQWDAAQVYSFFEVTIAELVRDDTGYVVFNPETGNARPISSPSNVVSNGGFRCQM